MPHQSIKPIRTGPSWQTRPTVGGGVEHFCLNHLDFNVLGAVTKVWGQIEKGKTMSFGRAAGSPEYHVTNRYTVLADGSIHDVPTYMGWGLYQDENGLVWSDTMPFVNLHEHLQAMTYKGPPPPESLKPQPALAPFDPGALSALMNNYSRFGLGY